MDVEKFFRHLCRLVLRHQMPVWNYFVNSFYSVVSPVARPGSPFIALDMLISSGFDSSPWVRVRFPTWVGKILNLNGPRSENRQWGDICPNASGDEWNSLLSATLR
jgi:hypothetical protein